MTLVIALPAPWLPEYGANAADARWPELPTLGRLLSAGRRLPDARDWRAGVLAQLAAASTDVAPVAVAASGLAAIAANTPLCFAAPLHVVAGISRVHLPSGRPLAMDEVEEQAWCAAFNQEFGSGDVKLHVGAPGGGWLLQAPFAPGARDAAPDALAGEALARQPAADASERRLRRLGAEVEMWLAAHVMNREREARREPVLNSIWFWGGGNAQAVAPVVGLAQVAGNVRGDAWLAGLARQAGTQVVQAGCWDEVGQVAPVGAGRTSGRLIVLAPEHGLADERFWQMAEEQWIAPLAQRMPPDATTHWLLQVGARAWRIPDRSLWRWFRPQRRTWWQMAGQERP